MFKESGPIGEKLKENYLEEEGRERGWLAFSRVRGECPFYSKINIGKNTHMVAFKGVFTFLNEQLESKIIDEVLIAVFF